ncbi:phage head closure protein [Micromonospora sp. NPDC049891]|uniref:phage head closure protein n=1 Tax=Micromonospora sp. NPDC049891 TaxID=3155655 RepID=UPI00340CB77F
MVTPVGLHELPRTFAVWRTTTAPDGAGGQTSTRAQVGSVRARVSQPTAAERVAAMQAGALLTLAVYMQPAADVRRGDELRGDGEVYRVKATVVPSEPAYLRADCDLVDVEGQ